MWHSASNVLTRKMLAIDSFFSKDLALAQYLVKLLSVLLTLDV